MGGLLQAFKVYLAKHSDNIERLVVDSDRRGVVMVLRNDHTQTYRFTVRSGTTLRLCSIIFCSIILFSIILLFRIILC